MSKTRTMRIEIVLATVAFAVTATAPWVSAPAAAIKNAPAFAKPIALQEFDGGEPSLAVDPSGNGGVYVSAPQSLGSLKPGVGFWASHDHGRTFPIRSQIGSTTGGGDSDVEVGLDHTVYVADLELAANAICRSVDGGKTFVDAGAGGGACNGNVTSQYGYISDREWLNHGPNGEIYLSYHDGHIELPYVLRSDDHGRTFTPCGADAFAPTGGEWQAFTPGPTSGTQVPKPVVGRDSKIYVMYATSSPTGAGGFDHLWVSSTPGCTAASVFRSRLVYQSAGASLAQPFDGFAMDGGGTLYVLASGHLNAAQTTDNVWLFRSIDQGETWSAPVRVNTPGLTANMLPAIAGGLRAGEVTVGWFGSSKNVARSGTNNEWRYYVANSFDGGRTFAQTAATGIMHKGPQARALLDFTSIAVEPGTGTVIAVFAGDADGTRRAYVVRQTGGRFLR